jgi:hypothetical protein
MGAGIEDEEQLSDEAADAREKARDGAEEATEEARAELDELGRASPPLALTGVG